MVRSKYIKVASPVIFMFFCLLSVCLQVEAEGAGIYQKKGIWQDKPEKQIDFVQFERVNFDFEKAPLKRVTKIALHDNNIFILDAYRNELYVIDKKGNYQYTIGRPGQGPGDIEYGWDFYISPDHKVYVLNSMPRRIEVFDIKGKPLETVKFMTSAGGGFTLPESILLDKKNNFIIGSAYANLVAMYDSKGQLIKPLLTLNTFRGYPRSNPGVGAPCLLGFIDDKIMAFESYKGIFAKINPVSGDVETVFSGYSKSSIESVKSFEEGGTGADARSKMITKNWSNICVDDEKTIYVFELITEKKGDAQRMFAFSPSGELLYIYPISFFSTEKVRCFDIQKDDFVFSTNELNIILAKRRK